MIKLATRFVSGIYYYLWEFYDNCLIALKYYRNPRFLLTDGLIQILYFFSNPYRLCYEYLARLPENQVQTCYGETSLNTFSNIVKRTPITASDVVYELGCGRGRLVFWLASVIGCKTVGVDLNPVFTRKAQWIKRWSKASKAEFLNQNIMELDLTNATIIYLYGSAFSDSAIENLIQVLSTARSETKIITVSYPLAHYRPDLFKVTDTLEGRFVWGKTTFYIQSRI